MNGEECRAHEHIRGDAGRVHDHTRGDVDQEPDIAEWHVGTRGNRCCDGPCREEPGARLGDKPPEHGAAGDDGILVAVENAGKDELVSTGRTNGGVYLLPHS